MVENLNYFTMIFLGILLYGIFIFSVKVLSTHVPMSIILLLSGVIMLIPFSINVALIDSYVRIDRYLIYILILGLVGGFGLILYYGALARGQISIVLPLWGVGVIIIPVVLGLYFLKEPLTATKVAGLSLAIAAILLLTR